MVIQKSMIHEIHENFLPQNFLAVAKVYVII